MRIQKIHDKGSHVINEDELLAEGNLYAVFDGAGSLVEFMDKENNTGGLLAARIAKSAFSENNAALTVMAEKANSEILAAMKKENIDTGNKLALWGSCAAAVRLKSDSLEFFGIGDSLVLALFNDGSYLLLTRHINHDLPALIKWKELADKKTVNIKQELMPVIRDIRKQSNISYGILNGDERAGNFFSAGKFPLRGVQSVIVFTDGFFIPKENPQEPINLNMFVELYNRSGLHGVLKHVRSLENEDPNCWKYPRLKKHDDATAIGIDFYSSPRK